jgi:succinate-acetate transporter protein
LSLIAEVETRIFIRPLGSALPLGFLSFGVGMFILGGIGVHSIPAADVKTAGLLIAAFVFPLELIATVIAFLARDTTGATTLGLFAGSWLAVGLVFMNAKPGETSRSLAYFLVYFGALVVLLAIAAMFGKPLIGVLLVLSSARAILAGIYEFTGDKGWETIGGALAFLIAGIALYGGLAFLLEDIHGRAVLPVFRRGEARDAIEGGLGDQLSRLENETGVRSQL